MTACKLAAFSIGLFAVSSGSFASEIGLGSAALQDLKSVLPASQLKCAVSTAADVLGLDAYDNDAAVALDNAGVGRYLSKTFAANPCLSQRAVDFWTPSAGSSRPDDGDHGYLGSSPVADAGAYYSRALKATGGDSNQALRVLATCTTTGAMGSVPMSAAQAKAYAQSKLGDLKNQIEMIRSSMQTLESKSVEFQASTTRLQMLESQQASYTAEVLAPKATLHSLPCNFGMMQKAFDAEAVSPELDIPAALKAKISNAQGRPQGEIPAKNYHFLGAAFLGCELVSKCGLSADTVSKVTAKFGELYRELRLDSEVRDFMADKDFVEANLDLSFQNRDALVKALGDRAKLKAICSRVSNHFCDLGLDNVDDASILKRKINTLVEEIDAATLFRKGFNEPGLSRPEADSAADRAQSARAFPNSKPASGNLCGVGGWSGDRCLSARQRLYGWNVDTEWTKTQHEIGGAFAGKHCQYREKPLPDQRLCDQAPGSPAADEKRNGVIK